MTEDYENGYRIKRLGLPQKFIPVQFRQGRPIATREYFPLTFRKAILQRTRWIMGITLQSWEYHTASETFRHLYWFWRDRKAVIGNLITPLANLLFAFGLATWSLVPCDAARMASRPRIVPVSYDLHDRLFHPGSPDHHPRGRVQPKSTAGDPPAQRVLIRVLVANAINCAATLRAIWI